MIRMKESPLCGDLDQNYDEVILLDAFNAFSSIAGNSYRRRNSSVCCKCGALPLGCQEIIRW